MPVNTRRSGITVETNGGVSIGTEIPDERASGGAGLPPPAVLRRGRRAARRAAVAAVPRGLPDEWSAIRTALENERFKVADSVPLNVEDTTPRTAAPGRKARRRRGQPKRATGTLKSTVDLGIPLRANEHAVVLLEQNGVYSWHFAVAHEPVRRPRTARKRAARASRTAPVRMAHVRIELSAPHHAERAEKAQRRGIVSFLVGKAVAYVLKFVVRAIAKPVLTAVAKWMERDVSEGLISITGTDPKEWRLLGPKGAIKWPRRRAPKVLLLVHGTFSSTVGSFGALGAIEEGQAFLTRALNQYDFVIGWDHRTLSVTPEQNARQLLTWLASQKWQGTLTFDAIAFSRGGLVLRSLVESLLPTSTLHRRMSIRRAVFVACTNGGTELARAANWSRFADTYMNLSAAGVRGLMLIPGVGVVPQLLSEAIRGLGSLLKILATTAVNDDAVPGLAAMDPAGPFVSDLNRKQPGQPTPGQVYYCAVTSNFDPDTARTEGDSHVLPTGLLLMLADKAADALYGKPNDLVVHVASMTQIDVTIGRYVREQFDYGTNGTVHHCAYFSQSETTENLERWLFPS